MRKIFYVNLMILALAFAVPLMAQNNDSLIIINSAVPPGDSGYVNINLHNTEFSVAGFALRVVLQDSIHTSFISAARGTGTMNFEYFNVRSSQGTCKIVSLANMPGGSDPSPLPIGVNQIARLQVRVSSQAPFGSFDSLSFMSDTLPPHRDNSISDSTGYNNIVPLLRGGRLSFTFPSGVDDEPSEILPEEYSLSQNYPNPFNAETNIKFILAEGKESISLSVYNILGREIRKFEWTNISAGEHSVTWDGRDSFGESVSSGIYFYRLNSPEFAGKALKMTLLK